MKIGPWTPLRLGLQTAFRGSAWCPPHFVRPGDAPWRTEGTLRNIAMGGVQYAHHHNAKDPVNNCREVTVLCWHSCNVLRASSICLFSSMRSRKTPTLKCRGFSEAVSQDMYTKIVLGVNDDQQGVLKNITMPCCNFYSSLIPYHYASFCDRLM